MTAAARRWWALAALGAGTALVLVARWRGLGHEVARKVRQPPLMGTWVPRLGVPALLVALLGAGLAWALPGWCRRVRWPVLLVGLAVVAAGWGVALASIRGAVELDRGQANEHEYVAVVDQVDAIGVGRFVDTFTDPEVLARYPIHVEGHPIGAALVYVGLDRIGLGGASGALWSLVVVGALAPPLVAIGVRAAAGERTARAAAPFLAVGPGAIWTVSSGDALFATVAAAALALLLVATARAEPTARRLLGAAGGATFGAGLLLTYGLVPLLLVPAAVAVHRRRFDVLVAAALGGVAVLAAAGLAGFWWFDGLAATRVRYAAGIASTRPRAYFTLLGNPAAFVLSLGPAVLVGLAWLRDRSLALLVGAALAAVAVADLSGLSKGEVERIWLPFAPWVTAATASITTAALATNSIGTASNDAASRYAASADAASGPVLEPAAPPSAGRRPRRPSTPLVSLALGAQVALAVAVESLVRTPW